MKNNDTLLAYDVFDKFGRLLFTGTLADCYEQYPTLACVEIGNQTSRGISVVVHGDY